MLYIMLLKNFNGLYLVLVFDVGKIDGEFGPLTGNGVKEYQKRHQLKVVDGVFNTETQSSLVDTVKHIQRRLWFLGYHIGNLGADGVLGHLTHGGIIAFQKDHELKQDGEVGMVTWSKLNEMIKHIQFALKHLSFACDVTGDSDEKTQTATKAFQTAKNLKVDGICGPLTISEIMKATKKNSKTSC